MTKDSILLFEKTSVIQLSESVTAHENAGPDDNLERNEMCFQANGARWMLKIRHLQQTAKQDLIRIIL